MRTRSGYHAYHMRRWLRLLRCSRSLSSYPLPLSMLTPGGIDHNIFAVYFSGNSPLLKSLSSAISNFSYHLTSAFILPSNSTTTSFAFPKSSSFFHVLCSIVNLFHCIKYFTTPLIFCLFKILFTFHSSTPSTSTSFASSTFCPSICSLYHTTWLTFTTGYILIEVGSYNLTTLVDIITKWTTHSFVISEP